MAEQEEETKYKEKEDEDEDSEFEFDLSESFNPVDAKEDDFLEEVEVEEVEVYEDVEEYFEDKESPSTEYRNDLSDSYDIELDLDHAQFTAKKGQAGTRTKNT